VTILFIPLDLVQIEECRPSIAVDCRVYYSLYLHLQVTIIIDDHNEQYEYNNITNYIIVGKQIEI